MGSWVAGGAYLPMMGDDEMSDNENGSVFLAGAYLERYAICEQVDNETHGGASTHCEISGVNDYKFPDDYACLEAIRGIMGKLGEPSRAGFSRAQPQPPSKSPRELYGILPADRDKPYELLEILNRLTDN